jgi:hypothetical protein
MNYQDIIDEVYLERQRLDPHPPDGFFHPSAMSGCARNAVYSLATEETDPSNERSLRIMGRGTEMHEEIQELTSRRAAEEGIAYFTEVKFKKMGVKGSADALLGVDGGLLQLQEYKSINPNGYRYLKEAKPEHVQQARIYHWALRDEHQLTDDIRFVYFDRDSWTVREFVEPAWNEFERHEFELDLVVLQNHAEEGTLPERMPASYWLCRYCNYRTACGRG